MQKTFVEVIERKGVIILRLANGNELEFNVDEAIQLNSKIAMAINAAKESLN